MIDTHLILIEGLPGSGKSTTAHKLAQALAALGEETACYFEWSPDHPIPIGDDLHLGEVIATARAREGQVLADWERYAHSQESRGKVTLIESRFWQTSVMLMYVAGLSREGVLASNWRVIEAIQPLNPVLIYFTVDDPEAFAARTMALKDAEWQRGGLPGTWAQHIFDAFEGQPWIAERGLRGAEALAALQADWVTVAERLYQQVPFPKIKVHNPHLDWPGAMQQILGFLKNLSPGPFPKKRGGE